jgi:hypothetical protein
MSTYNISGGTLTIDGANGSGNIGGGSTINPVTGGASLNTVRIVNTSNANIATVGYTLSNTTYSFANVTGTASGGGANAKFNVTVANTAGYQVSIANAGTGYSNAETITILGNNLGGTTTTNDLTLTLTVGNAGAITSVAASGTRLWPQSTTANIPLLPLSENFIQVATNQVPTSTGYIGAYFTSTGGNGSVYITPVTLVG